MPVAQEASGGQGGLLSYVDTDAARSGAAIHDATPAAAAANGEDSNGSVPPRAFLPFEGADVKGRGARQLKRGDPVEFSISTDARTGKRRATQVPRSFPPAALRAQWDSIAGAGKLQGRHVHEEHVSWDSDMHWRCGPQLMRRWAGCVFYTGAASRGAEAGGGACRPPGAGLCRQVRQHVRLCQVTSLLSPAPPQHASAPSG